MGSTNGGGLWYSVFQDLVIYNFPGSGMIFDATSGGSPSVVHQFISVRDVYIQRMAGGAAALKLLGVCGQFSFDRCQFDGTAKTDSVSVIISQGTAPAFVPSYTINMNNVTMQSADHAIDVIGCDCLILHSCHFETLNGVMNAVSSTNYNNGPISLINCYFIGNVGVNAGAGYIINTTSNTDPTSILFAGNLIYSVPNPPDHMFLGQINNISGFGNVVGFTLPYNVIGGGLDNNGGGLKHARITTGSIGAGARASVTITWGTAFPDTNYTVTGSVADPTTGTSQGLVLERLNAVTGAISRATVFNPTGGALTGTLNCIAIHDATVHF